MQMPILENTFKVQSFPRVNANFEVIGTHFIFTVDLRRASRGRHRFFKLVFVVRQTLMEDLLMYWWFH